MERHQREQGSTETLNTLRRVFRILESLGVRMVAELADETLDSRFVAFTASEGWADSTRDMLRGHLHAVIRRAHKWGLLPCQPPIPSRVKPGGRQSRSGPSPIDTHPLPESGRGAALLEYFHARKDTWKGFRSYAYLMTIAWTRLSLRRAIMLRRDNVLLKKGDPLAKGDVDMWPTPVFRFRSRNGKERHLPIHPNLATDLQEWMIKNGSLWWVFPGLKKDGPWCLRSPHGGTPASVLREACLDLGLEPFTCEQLRDPLSRHDPRRPAWPRRSTSPRRHQPLIPITRTSTRPGLPTGLTRSPTRTSCSSVGSLWKPLSWATFTGEPHPPGRTSSRQSVPTRNGIGER